MRRLISIVLILLVSALALAACGDDGGEDPAPASPAPPTTAPDDALSSTPTPAPRNTPLPRPELNTDPLEAAWLRVVHASAELPAVSVYLGGENIARSVTQGQYNSSPLGVDPGDYLLRVVPAGENPDRAEPLLTYPLTLAEGVSTVLVLTGGADDPQVILAEENLAPLPDNITRLTAIHAVPRGATFDLVADGLTLLSTLDYGATGEPVETDAGPVTFAFASGPETLTTLEANLFGRRAYTLVLTGDAATGEYRAISFNSPVHDETPVRVIHASPNLPAVDVCLGETVLAEELVFGEASDWASLRSLGYDLRLECSGFPGEDPAAMFQQRVSLVPNQELEIVLLDEAERLRAVTVEADLSPTPEATARLTFVNAAPGTLRLAIETFGGPVPGVPEISFGSASPPVYLTTGREEFLFLLAGGAEEGEIDRLAGREWAAGHAYTVVVTGHPERGTLVFETEVGTDGTSPADAAQDTAAFDDPESAGPPPSFASPTIRVVNALPDPVAVTFDSVPAFDAIASGTATAYYEFDTAPETLTVRGEAGTLLAADLPGTSDVAAMTLFLFRDADGVRHVLVPDLPYAVPGGQAALRVLHAASTLPALQAVRRADPPSEETESLEGSPVPPQEEPLGSQARFGTPTDPQVIPAGTYDVLVREVESGTLVLSIPDVPFESRGIYDLLLLPDPSGLSVIPVLVPVE